MQFLNRGLAVAIGALALGFAAIAGAQENLDQGKSGAQLFASDCAICHKTTAGLSKGRIVGLESFLREHYTASRESAAIIAAYIQATDKGPATPAPARAAKKGVGLGDDKKMGAEKKSDTGNPGDAKPAEAKPAEAKPAEAKPAEAKPAEAKPAEAKPTEARPADTKPAESKPTEEKKSEPKPPQTPKSD
jgi:hypothetical protein